ncbi:hypothetical protein RHECNPAF_254005 [Rhizobium etli CNPAF512]|nr:hypothetical protein RHECNPAF_254005 [Rhizobium etli CNPAF512]
MLHAITRHQLGQRHGITLTSPKFFKTLFGEIDILKIIEMFENGLTGIEALAAARTLGKLVEPGFDFRRQPQGQHVLSPVCYTNIASGAFGYQQSLGSDCAWMLWSSPSTTEDWVGFCKYSDGRKDRRHWRFLPVARLKLRHPRP